MPKTRLKISAVDNGFIISIIDPDFHETIKNTKITESLSGLLKIVEDWANESN